MNILQLSAHYSPNTGGVETHLDDLVAALIKRKHRVTVLTYQPLSSPVSAPFMTKANGLQIIRLPWIKGLFYQLVDNPAAEFLYLFPGLFFALPFVLIRRKYQIIHAHGLIAATVGVFWGKMFSIKTVVSTHSLYHFPKQGLYRSFVQFVLSHAQCCLCLSKKSVEELISLGIDPERVKQFTYWIDLEQFQPMRSNNFKAQVHLQNQFVVMFVGRLIEEKGIRVLIKTIKKLKGRITLVIAGDGPLKDEVVKEVQNNEHIRYLGKLNGEELSFYYNLADLLVVPSIHDEGFGRVIIEALACSLPVLGSDRGSIPEALDDSVGQLANVTVKNLQKQITYLKTHPNVLKKLKQNGRRFAVRRYSEKNIETIINSYDN